MILWQIPLFTIEIIAFSCKSALQKTIVQKNILICIEVIMPPNMAHSVSGLSPPWREVTPIYFWKMRWKNEHFDEKMFFYQNVHFFIPFFKTRVKPPNPEKNHFRWRNSCSKLWKKHEKEQILKEIQQKLKIQILFFLYFWYICFVSFIFMFFVKFTAILYTFKF